MRTLARAVDALAAEVRETPGGVRSLDHVVAVVPTAESARRLRFALARRFGALVPPEVKLPEALFVDPADPTLATRADELVAFNAALAASSGSDLFRADEDYALAAQLSDLRRILFERQLEFADVVEAAEEFDRPRWTALAEVERRYYEELEKLGKRDRIRVAKAHGDADDAGRRVFRFDLLPPADPGAVSALRNDSIVPAATAADEAERIAGYFAAVAPDEALPTLCVADPEMFPELKSAFAAKGMHLHDPSRTKLTASSLGHLVEQLSDLVRTGSYQVFSSFVRGGDVRRWLCENCSLTDEEMIGILVDLDNRQQQLLPEKIDDIAPKTEKKLRRVFEFVKVQLRKKGVRGMLESIFASRVLDAREESSREFAAAAEAVNAILPYAGEPALFARLLAEAEYSLEPDEGEVILADGWLELPFLETDELVIAGFREGRVPESTVGHPFLPDALRTKLGLADNAARERRDRAIFAEAVVSTPRLTVSFHALDAKGDVCKPSRLLFETDDDRELLARVQRLYGIRAGTSPSAASDLPRTWKLQLPVPPVFEPLVKISPTRLDSYLKCPFTYFLRRKDVLGDKRLDDRAEELASWEYGNLAHDSLEQWGLSELKDSDDETVIGDFLEERVDAQLVDRFGTAIPAIVAMQGESVKRRLRHFAAAQARHRREGWRIVTVERKLELQYDGHTRLYGKCDRIDRNERTGEWLVIDYKTWDRADKAAAFVTGRDGTTEWNSLQLPIYCAMLDALDEDGFAEAKRDRISSCYCVLGRTADDVRFTEPFDGGMVPSAEEKIRELISRIEQGIFWPPGKSAEWRWDYEDWLGPDPEETVDEAWIADQNRRRKAAGDVV